MKQQFTDQQISDMLRGMDEFVSVPRDVTRAWQSAVRRESKSHKLRRRVTWAIELAAAFLLVIGLTAFTRGFTALESSRPNASEAGVKYMYLASSETPALLGSDNSASGLLQEDDGLLLTQTTGAAQAAQGEASHLPSANPASDTSETETEESAFDGDQPIRYAQAAIRTGDTAQAGQMLRTVLGGFDASIAEESSRVTSGVSSVSGVIRVSSFQLDSLIEALKNCFDDIDLSVRSIDPAEVSQSVHERTEAAYAAIDHLNALMDTADPEQMHQLYAQINQLYDDIDSYRADAQASMAGDGWSAVFYTIRAQEKSVLALGFTGGAGSFALDAAKTLALLLPVIALTALITWQLSRKRNRVSA